MSLKQISVFLLIQLICYFRLGTCGKVLVWPTEYSHWINIKIIVDELVQKGHEVTVLTSSASILIDPSSDSSINFEIYPVPVSKEELQYMFQSWIAEWTYDFQKYSFWTYYSKMEEKSWSQFYSEALGRPTTLSEMIGKADIWLIRTYWDLQFPHPLLPNFDFVGGLHCKPAKPLPKEMEDFVQSSGEHGIVVFSLGSMVKNISSEKANIVASAFAQLPQKVLWRFDGKKPDTLASNTRLYKWIPQNDLLGHPKTKAFIAHGGTNGIYEAIYHGIPIVGIPLFADQPDNINHMVAKGAAIRVDFSTLSTTKLLTALRTVINDPSYKENAMRLSRIQHDQPVKPLDKAVFWIEYVMRNRGAKHLRPALHDLTWFQYHSLDVIGFLLACVAAVVFIITKCCLFCYHKTANMGKKKKKE
ncbi:UDP-glucuronosyltransferase 2B1 isoform X3 [Chionomys nivalis]|uniref:UDP-glucuronosyltransferase 2B1 isoform X3 n=1 Tax=Chionomys nivalis TaxID=269649 RepID=UPI002597A796|nr:UDP-glucuronosyltransferase 2B1 isoform X3 [Chionomys nivalis]